MKLSKIKIKFMYIFIIYVSASFQELVVNSVCISGDKKYIVTGTDNNLVCIWKRSPNDTRPGNIE